MSKVWLFLANPTLYSRAELFSHQLTAHNVSHHQCPSSTDSQHMTPHIADPRQKLWLLFHHQLTNCDLTHQTHFSPTHSLQLKPYQLTHPCQKCDFSPHSLQSTHTSWRHTSNTLFSSTLGSQLTSSHIVNVLFHHSRNHVKSVTSFTQITHNAWRHSPDTFFTNFQLTTHVVTHC
jgi:hypothetical protein